MTPVAALVRTVAGVARLGVASRVAIAVMIVLDLAVIGGNLIYLTVDEPGREPRHPVFSDVMWNGDVDNSWMERVSHLQLVGGAIGCSVLWRRERQRLYLVTAALLLWIAVDDAARIHERGGALFRAWGVGEVVGIGPQSLGEMAVWAVAGGVMGLVYVLAWRSSDPVARRRTTAVLTAFAVLLFFALVVDILDSLITPYVNSWIQTGMALLENCGELVAVTLIVAAVLVQVGGADSAAHPDSTRSEAEPSAPS